MIGEIVAIRKVDCDDEFVYNLEVQASEDRNKNYYADGVLVSNCHRLSQQANDALLKAIEEPPALTRFVLCTTDVAKMRPAIVSRCQKHDFTRIFWMQIAEYLSMVAKEENIKIETGAINLCAKRARGSMRSALGYLEKLYSFAGTAFTGNPCITTADAEQMFGTVSEVKFYDLFEELINDKGTIDTTKGFRIINEMFMNGADYTSIADGIVEHLDMLMIGMTSSKASDLVHLSEDGKTRLIAQLKKCREQDKLLAILRSMEELSKSSQWVVFNPNPESALRKWFLESAIAFRATQS
jgi:DNA polymerase-3 subunit gamma/tau